MINKINIDGNEYELGGGALIDLGKIDEDPNNANNSVLNNIKQTGLYTFTYNYKSILTTFTYLMKVEYRGERYIQTIFEAYIEDKNYFNFIVRKSPYFFGDWEVSNFQLVDRAYVYESVSKLGDNIKVADLTPNVNLENNIVDFTFENCPAIDFFKGVRVEITDINNNKEIWIINIASDVINIDDNKKQIMFQPVLSMNGTYGSVDDWEEEFISSVGLYYTLNETGFWLTRRVSDIDYEQLSAKIYYHEADETTQILSYEL